MNEVLTIAVVSGKGGVGKTMLSVAIANELARGTKTLILDLDFFNRGLTGLFASAVARARPERVSPPAFFDSAEAGNSWCLTAVRANLFTVSYGDIESSQSGVLETMDIDAVSAAISAFISELCDNCGCKIVILDCHGGPDKTSFAACALADHTILVPNRTKLLSTERSTFFAG